MYYFDLGKLVYSARKLITRNPQLSSIWYLSYEILADDWHRFMGYNCYALQLADEMIFDFHSTHHTRLFDNNLNLVVDLVVMI